MFTKVNKAIFYNCKQLKLFLLFTVVNNRGFLLHILKPAPWEKIHDDIILYLIICYLAF
jgi:hypothetical protein